jgi:hypothetical protein
LVDALSHGGTGPTKIKVDTIGTGETIGHVADLKIQNITGEPLNLFIPTLILESKSAKSQDYVVPQEHLLAIAAGQAETIPLNGVCINRDKPPVGKGVAGELVINTIDPKVPQYPDCHIAAKQAADLVHMCTAKYAAIEKLQKDGLGKDFPYKDKQQQTDILMQWSMWSDARVSEIAKAPPATKEDLKKVAYKQVEEKAPMTSDTKKKIDKGLDTIFEKVELTSAKAKDLEKSEQAGDQPPAPQTG